jgi:DNA polymerase/3'-5' exonuclease PolX
MFHPGVYVCNTFGAVQGAGDVAVNIVCNPGLQSGGVMIYEQAKKICDAVVEMLTPHCERIEPTGNLRRMKKDVHYIEVVCIPNKLRVKDGLWEWKEYNSDGFVSRAKRNGYAMSEGIVYDLHRKPIRVEDEKMFFRLCNEQWVKPEYRIG